MTALVSDRSLRTRRGYGLGQGVDIGYYDSSGNWISTGGATDTSSVNLPSLYNVATGAYSGAGAAPLSTSQATTSTGSTSSSTAPWWAGLLSTGVKTASQIAIQQTLPAGYSYQATPYGTVLTPGSLPASLSSLTSGSLMPLLLLGGGGLLLLMMMSKR